MTTHDPQLSGAHRRVRSSKPKAPPSSQPTSKFIRKTKQTLNFFAHQHLNSPTNSSRTQLLIRKHFHHNLQLLRALFSHFSHPLRIVTPYRGRFVYFKPSLPRCIFAMAAADVPKWGFGQEPMQMSVFTLIVKLPCRLLRILTFYLQQTCCGRLHPAFHDNWRHSCRRRQDVSLLDR